MKQIQNLAVEEAWGCIQCRKLDCCPVGKAFIEDADFCLIGNACDVEEQVGGEEPWDSDALSILEEIQVPWKESGNPGRPGVLQYAL
jgi:hypothetical protein